ncbi:MAG: M20 family metallopeptidase [Symbiobacteriaceae bacterium]|nr:M20 family metallopeptidase [Symbiobacteriaceae bacterium]
MSKDLLYQSINSRVARYTQTSDAIWGFAELRYEEENSSRALIQLLTDEGFNLTEIGEVPNAFVASFGEGKPVIGFLGEFDALAGLSQVASLAQRQAIVPGACGHGCGHHLLGVGAAAAAIALKDYLQQSAISGTVKYYGCPGEEGGSGKAFMAREGVFKGLDAAITWHSGDTNAVSSGSSLANIQVYFRFIGKASHAGGSPHLGRSALDAIELMNVGVNYMREHMIPDARVHYAMIDGGGKSPNVVQPFAEQLYLIRAPKNDQVKELFERVVDIARGAALMTQTQMEFQVDKACSNLIPNTILEELMYQNLCSIGAPQPNEASVAFASEIRETLNDAELANKLRGLQETYGGPEGRRLSAELDKGPIHTFVMPLASHERTMHGSTDVSDVSWLVPTVQCNTACWALSTPGHSWQQVAQGKEKQAYEAMLYAAKAMAATGLDLLLQPELLAKACEELQERIGPAGYICPIPPGVQPSKVK